MKEGWELKTIGEVCEVIAGQSPEGKFYNKIGNGIPFYQGKKEYGEKYLGEPTTWTTKITKEAKEDDILMSVRAPVGPVNFATQKICIGRGLAAIRTSKLIDKEFLYSFLIKFESEIIGNTGAVFNSINKAQIEAIKIPLPPLPEQQRIVAILDDAFAKIEKAKANAEQNLKNAKELFESYLQGVFEDKGDDWEEKTFEDVCNLVGGSQPSKDDFIYEPKEGYIRLIQVRDYRTSKYITYIPKDKARRFCSENDIMIGRYGPPIFGIFKGLEGAYNVALMKAEVNTKICYSDYFFWFLKTNKLRVFVENSSKRAAGQDGIRKELLDKYPVPLPKSLKTQQSIVQKLEALSSETKKLEVIYQNKINDLEELKKSVLQNAFSGDL
jgi:type I restriction enzyme, S subunit